MISSILGSRLKLAPRPPQPVRLPIQQLQGLPIQLRPVRAAAARQLQVAPPPVQVLQVRPHPQIQQLQQCPLTRQLRHNPQGGQVQVQLPPAVLLQAVQVRQVRQAHNLFQHQAPQPLRVQAQVVLHQHPPVVLQQLLQLWLQVGHLILTTPGGLQALAVGMALSGIVPEPMVKFG